MMKGSEEVRTTTIEAMQMLRKLYSLNRA